MYVHTYNEVNQQDATTFSFNNPFKISPTRFGRQIRPSSGAFLECIYYFWYNAPTLLPTGAMVEMELKVHLDRGTSRQYCRCIVAKAVYTFKKCSWGWANLSPETFRADLKRIIKQKGCCILLVVYFIVLKMHGQTNIKYVHTYIYTYICTYVVRTYIHTYVRTYTHTYVRTYIHAYIHSMDPEVSHKDCRMWKFPSVSSLQVKERTFTFTIPTSKATSLDLP